MLSARTVRKIEQAISTRPTRLAPIVDDDAHPLTPENEPAAILRAAVTAMKGGHASVEALQVQSDDLQGIRLFRGDILMVDTNATPKAGDIVCAQMFDMSIGRPRTILRLYDPPYLLSGGTSHVARRPETADGRTVTIIGVVIARLSAREMLHLAS